MAVLNLSTIRARPGRHWLSVEDTVELQLQVRKRILVDNPKAFGLDVVLDQVNAAKVDPRHGIEFFSRVVQVDTNRDGSHWGFATPRKFSAAWGRSDWAGVYDGMVRLYHRLLRNTLSVVRGDWKCAAKVRSRPDDHESSNLGKHALSEVVQHLVPRDGCTASSGRFSPEHKEHPSNHEEL